jgi:hypothetical protein
MLGAFPLSLIKLYLHLHHQQFKQLAGKAAVSQQFSRRVIEQGAKSA